MEKHIPAHSTSPCRGCKHYSGKQFVPLHKARAFVGALFFGKLNPAGVGFADPDHDLTPRRLFGLGGAKAGGSVESASPGGLLRESGVCCIRTKEH